MNVTILICIYNGAKKIKDTLFYISKLIIPDTITYLELLIVDNNSTDNSIHIIEDYCQKYIQHIPLICIHESKPGKANALYRGYNEAKGDLIILCDDDNWLNSSYLINSVNIFNQHPDIGLASGYGINAIFDEGERPDWFDNFQNYYVVGKHHQKTGYLEAGNYAIYGAGSILRKSVWNDLVQNGFVFLNSTGKGKAITEDVELAFAVSITKYRLFFDENLTFQHDLRGGRVTWENLKQQEYFNGRGNVPLIIYDIIRKNFIKQKLHLKQLMFLIFVIKYLSCYFKINKQIKKIKRKISTDRLTELNLIRQESISFHLINDTASVYRMYKIANLWIFNLLKN